MAYAVGIKLMAPVQRVEIANFVSIYFYHKTYTVNNNKIEKIHRTINNTLSEKRILN